MKAVQKATLIAFVFLSLLLGSCSEKGLICTDEYRMIIVSVENSAGAPVVLDEVYTLRNSTGEKITYTQNPAGGYYLVLDDSYHHSLKNDDGLFTFVGKSGGKLVFEEIYNIAGDACHIHKRAGKEKIIVQ